MQRKSGFLTALSYLYGALLRLIVIIFRLGYAAVASLLILFEGLLYIFIPSASEDGSDALSYFSDRYETFENVLRTKLGKRV